MMYFDTCQAIAFYEHLLYCMFTKAIKESNVLLSFLEKASVSIYLTTLFFEYRIVKINIFTYFRRINKWNTQAEMYQLILKIFSQS